MLSKLFQALANLLTNSSNITNWLFNAEIEYIDTSSVDINYLAPGDIIGVIRAYANGTHITTSPIMLITTGLASFIAIFFIAKLLKSLWDAIPVV